MKKIALLLIILLILTKISGFGRDIILSYYYGASHITDAYLISVTVPTMIFTFIGVGISANFIPMYSNIEKKSGFQLADRFTNNVVNFILVACSLIVLIGLILTEPIIKIFASGFEGETLCLAVNFTKISIIGIYFSASIYIFAGYLQLKNNFVVPALMGIPLNVTTIIFIIMSNRFGVMILSIGSVIALFFQLVFLLPFVHKKGYHYRLVLDKSDEYLTKMIYLSLPVIIGISANQINVLVDRTIASRIAVGSISALTYANRINLFIKGIFVTSIATVMYPMLSKMAAENNLAGYKRLVSEAINGVNLLVIPATVGAMLFSKPVVKLLFGRGAFDFQAISMTSYALFFYSIGMGGFGLREVLSRAFYSLQDTKIPMINAAIAMIINIFLNIILSKFLGIGGLALATSISAIFCTVLLFISLRKKIGPFGMKKISISFLKILCASLVMGLIAKLSFNYLTKNISQNLSLIIAIGIGAATYFTIIYYMKIDDVDVIVNAIKRKMKKSAT